MTLRAQSLHQVRQGQSGAVDFRRIGFGNHANMSLMYCVLLRAVWVCSIHMQVASVSAGVVAMCEAWQRRNQLLLAQTVLQKCVLGVTNTRRLHKCGV